jgi:glycosyltransferase involved in cell wall biosynthesis
MWTLRRIAMRHQIALIHCNEQDIYPIGAWLARVSRLPIVVSVHFTMDRLFCQWAFGGWRMPDRMFFISKGSLAACREGVSGIVPEANWFLLPNGLDLTHYRQDDAGRQRFRRQNSLTTEVVAVGVACAIRPRKQLEHLFEAVARLADLPVRVLVAGWPVPGDEEYVAGLIENGRSRLGDRLTFLGYLNDLRDLFNGLDIFVNTSREEACSITVLESLACGCPVLGYPSKSVDEQVLPNGGEIVPQDDVDRLTAALRMWVGDPAKLPARRPGARLRAEQDYDIRRLAERLWKEYQQLVARG